jgi:glutamine cyclotransferase
MFAAVRFPVGWIKFLFMEWVFRILFLLVLDTPVRPGVILHAYPHDSLAYTQGLVFHDGYMYESTGLTKRSSLRKVDVKTGKVLFQYNLPPSFFGEGMTIYRDKIYQLTWKNRLCLVYDLKSMCFERAFKQPADGWGLAHCDSLLIMSDGTSMLYFIDPDTFILTGSIEVHDDRGMVKMLNELEVIDGILYANILNRYVIAKICLRTGTVLEYIDFTSLKNKHQTAMNGMSYSSRLKKMYLTGKLWNKLYEVDLLHPPSH